MFIVLAVLSFEKRFPRTVHHALTDLLVHSPQTPSTEVTLLLAKNLLTSQQHR
jgi:hypothetical protein